MKIKLTSILILLIAFIGMIALIPNVSANSNFYPSLTTVNLIPSTPGENIFISYSNHVHIPKNAKRCIVKVTFNNDNNFGITPKIQGKIICNLTSGFVYIPLSFNGEYNGEGGEYNPISSITIKFYNINGTNFATETYYTNPFDIKPVKLSVKVYGNPISGSISYSYYPSNPKIEETITVFPSAPITVTIQTSSPPTEPVQLLFSYNQTSSGITTESFTVNAGVKSMKLKINNTDISAPLYYQILSNDYSYELAQGVINLPSYTHNKYKVAVLTVYRPYAVYSINKKNVLSLVGATYIYSLPPSSSISLQMIANGRSNKTTIDKSGVSFITLEVKSKNNTLSGEYYITYNGKYGSISFNVPFSTSIAKIFTGGIITIIFYYTFLVLIVSSFMATIFGFLLRRMDIMTSGLLTMASSVIVFMIPTLIAYILDALFASGLQDPAHVANLNMLSIGGAIDRSIEYTVKIALTAGHNLFIIGLVLLGALVTLAFVAAGVGVVGWLTAGALSRFIGGITSDLGGQLITLATYSFIASYLLQALAYVYPIVINLTLMILLFSTVLYAIYGAFTGNIGQAYRPIIQFSILILAILLVPPLLYTIGMLRYTVGIGAIAKIFGWTLPNPFFWVADTVLQIVILVFVMYMALQSLVSTLAGTRE